MSIKWSTIVFAVLIFITLFQVFRFISIGHANNGLRALFTSKQTLTHPIPKLMADAEAKYNSLLSRQSKSFLETVAEYRRRYKLDPPKGFDQWYEFAMENNVKIIDEYDGMMEDLAPFRDLSGEEIRRRVLQVGLLPSVDLVRLRNGTTITLNIEKGFLDDEIKIQRVGGPRAKGFRVMVEKFQDKLPDMDFPINAKAEGRILVPWEHQTYPNMTLQDSSGGVESMLGSEFIPDWRGDGNVWESYRRTCHPSSQARRLFGSIRGQNALPASGRIAHSYLKVLERTSSSSVISPDSDLIFAERPDDEYDFCTNPWARYQQGNFFSDWRTIPVLYPIFSPGKVRGFSDIKIPSHYYYSSTPDYTYGWDEEKLIVHDVDESEVPWEQKTDLIFWRGSTTGGGSSPPGFLTSYQRHRFMEMATTPTNITRSIVFADPQEPKNYITAEVPLQGMNEEFIDTAFTKAVGCDEFPRGGCEAMMRHYRFAHSVPLGEHWKHKYLIDFDGMGYSARAMAFLASESAMVKSTVYREFFSDWIQPWLHYIPLSQSYKEIYNIHAFFSGPSPSMLRAANSSALSENARILDANDGDRRLRRIAQAGREWKQTVGRKVDMETYVYRLCLEFARLYADDRDAMSLES
ncbi:glycosyltransferase family 90 protein [Ramaria rubella]|nr:glycosyltransferase family 90 protein [Ramaria rubella]